MTAPQDSAVPSAFLRDGYVIAPTDDREALDEIRQHVARAAARHLGIEPPSDISAFMNTIATRCDAHALNELRLAVIGELLRWTHFRDLYFACGRSLLEAIVGNELAMQRGVGFSIQLPNDADSVLPLHSDVWSEDSAFEVVLWIPLVDVFGSKSMFLLPLADDLTWRDRVATYRDRGIEAVYHAVEPMLHWLEIPYGSVLVFSHTVMHGNRVNRESTARWSLNVRFKGLFTPYADKRLGEFFEPLTIRPASRLGMTYRLPTGFDS